MALLLLAFSIGIETKADLNFVQPTGYGKKARR